MINQKNVNKGKHPKRLNCILTIFFQLNLIPERTILACLWSLLLFHNTENCLSFLNMDYHSSWNTLFLSGLNA